MNKQIKEEYEHIMDEIKSDNIYYSLSEGTLRKSSANKIIEKPEF